MSYMTFCATFVTPGLTRGPAALTGAEAEEAGPRLKAGVTSKRSS